MRGSLHEMARLLKGEGRRGDTVLAHISPKEAAWLAKRTDGKVDINPSTGLPEFYDEGDGNEGNDNQGGSDPGQESSGSSEGVGGNNSGNDESQDSAAYGGANWGGSAPAQSEALANALIMGPDKANVYSPNKGFFNALVPFDLAKPDRPNTVHREDRSWGPGYAAGRALGFATAPVASTTMALGRALMDAAHPSTRGPSMPAPTVAQAPQKDAYSPTFGGLPRGTENNSENQWRIASALMGPRSV